MRGNNVGDAGDEGRVVVGGRAPAYPLSPNLFPKLLCVFDVELVQCFNVVIDEGDGDEHEVLLAPLDEGLDGLLSPRLQPG